MFISCGDILVDLFSQPTDTAGKVALQGHVGGSPLNVAIGLSRMGNQAGYLCKNSVDFIGQQIAAYLESNQILPDWVLPSELNSTLAMIKTNPDGSANYAFYTDNTADQSMTVEDLPAAFPESLDLLHFASYSTAVGATSKALKALAQREAGRRVISYDPNLRPSVEPDMDIWRESFTAFSSVADFVKASDEDIGSLLGSGKSLESFAVDTLAAGASVVVVTEGGSGATIYSADGRQFRSKSLSIKVVDTVGAGDTFQAASLHWLKANGCMIAGKLNVADADLEACVNFAAVAAAITCTRHGADLPSLQEIEAGLVAI
ncbi:carbohydrate kinase family protein [Granulosicoccus antarcticus]|uniref:2-dehydro-3-deoxygluconokinase n=1 Tax=Granulosicoccus antarcticus IMCC3135 TaxID=1192854 RepID=A0A2Z2NPY7_9GAMM|nr:carbohydrate kinase [Granulosicoccus antarcticus]ASJ72525.1 2-dehydro-3-deoxygluconokinase [Granulosicoccus antarcticus IMCC3135]